MDVRKFGLGGSPYVGGGPAELSGLVEIEFPLKRPPLGDGTGGRNEARTSLVVLLGVETTPSGNTSSCRLR